MELPVIIAVEPGPSALNDLVRDLKRRYDEEYEIAAAANARAGLEALQRLHDQGRAVALVIADLDLPDTGGLEFLGRARSLHPLARRAALVDTWEFFANEPLRRAMTLGLADSWLTRPWAPPGELLYPAVTELLGEWMEESDRRKFFVAQVVGEHRTPQTHECLEVLERNGIPYSFHTADSPDGRRLLRRAERGQDRLPVVVLSDGRVLVRPTNADLVGALGVKTRPSAGPCDLVVVGGGPAGLSAAVCAASEGLRTLLVEREAFGGQAGTSSRIRNYLGFPHGVSGRRLARGAYQQATLFGAEMVYGEAVGLRAEGTTRVVQLRENQSAIGRTVLIATGVTYRRLGVPAVERFEGAGVFYDSALSEAVDLRGQETLVVGGGNSAGQAAVRLSAFASRVTLVVRGEGLATSMSDYLRRELESLENLTIRLGTQVVHAAGAGCLGEVTLEDVRSGARTTVPAAALFILIGSEPRTQWLAGTLERDRWGFIRTGPDISPRRAARARLPPAPVRPRFESSLPGVFAAGDVRCNSEKRVAAAAGEGSAAIGMIHEYLGSR